MMNMTSWLHKLKFLREILFFSLLLLIGQSLWADHQSGDIVTYLRNLAERLGWSQEIFASVKARGEDYQVLGIADRSFYELTESAEKGYVQWLLALHPLPLEKVLQKHLRDYRRQGFKVVAIPGVGDQMYRAYLASYILKDGKLVLTRSQDAVEILFGPEMLTLKDERLKLDADVWSIFEEVFEVFSKEGFVRSLPEHIPKEPNVKTPFEGFSKEITVADIFPLTTELSENVSEWKMTEDFSKEDRGQMLVNGRTYKKKLLGSEKNSSSVQVVLYAYPSMGQAKRALRLYRKKLRDVLIDTSDKKGFWISKEGSMKERLIFSEGIFICDLELTGSEKSEDKKSLEKSSLLIQGKIRRLLGST